MERRPETSRDGHYAEYVHGHHCVRSAPREGALGRRGPWDSARAPSSLGGRRRRRGVGAATARGLGLSGRPGRGVVGRDDAGRGLVFL